MKKHHKTNNISKINKSARNKIKHCCLNEIAKELERISKQRLPNYVLRGELTGNEEDIRQQAVVLALGWYLRSLDASANKTRIPWQTPRAIAGALRLIKRDVLKELDKEKKVLQSAQIVDNQVMVHPTMIPVRDWPISAMHEQIIKAIHIAHKSKKISLSNAAIAREILLEGTPISKLAGRLKIHRSAVAQQFGRVRRHLPPILETLEIPLNEIY